MGRSGTVCSRDYYPCSSNWQVQMLRSREFNSPPQISRERRANIRRATRRKMAARLGVEPRQAESESAVLPLHHQAVENQSWGRARLPARDLGPDREESEPATGVEPATTCLQNRCSAIELRRQKTRENGGRRATATAPENERIKEQRPGAGHPAPVVKIGGSPGTRTPNLLIKSQLLYH